MDWIVNLGQALSVLGLICGCYLSLRYGAEARLAAARDCPTALLHHLAVA